MQTLAVTMVLNAAFTMFEPDTPPGTLIEVGGEERPPAPVIQREGYVSLDLTGVQPDALIGERVYDLQDIWVGDVRTILADPSNGIAALVIEVGGFLGIGERPVAVALDDLTFLREEQTGNLRIYLHLSDEALDALPDYAE
ncbi:MAG: PRC-barrel domain-containing protein [Alterinioella nitratireducens]|uniref:PRC-barrel domain-containing protein n=1 Tax=Alterinioella nitratireducens TaxID=2735915 RepID=UPI004059368D